MPERREPFDMGGRRQRADAAGEAMVSAVTTRVQGALG